MTSTGADGLFDLHEVHRSLSGRRIKALHAPMVAGLARLHAALDGCRFAAFDHVTEFDMDGMFTSIGCIEGFRERDDALSWSARRRQKRVTERLLDGRWKPWETPARAVNVLPATGNIVPGTFPRHTGFAALRASDYETVYVRTYLVEAAPGELVGAVLANDGFREEFVDVLARLGGYGR